MKRLTHFVLFFLLSANLFSQPQEKTGSVPSKSIFIEKDLIPSSHGSICIVSFRIPYSELVFVKNHEKFQTGITIDFDLKANDQIFDRRTYTKSFSVSSYDSTLSESDFFQGFISFNPDKGDYCIFPYVKLENNDQIIQLDTIKVELKNEVKGKVYNPVIVRKNPQTNCINEAFELINYENTIPYIGKNCQLLIPVKDSTVSLSEVRFERENKTLFNKKLRGKEGQPLVFQECGNSVILQSNRNEKSTTYYYIEELNNYFKEGPLNIVIVDKDSAKYVFETKVYWSDKPRSLRNPELAIQLLAAIEKPETVDSLLSNSRKDYPEVIAKYWASKNHYKSSTFNHLEMEFYKRADYAVKEFTTLGVKNGGLSDRGIIYIRNGKPDEIKRGFNDSSLAVEIWIYSRLNKEFVFVDKTGLGNFTLGK